MSTPLSMISMTCPLPVGLACFGLRHVPPRLRGSGSGAAARLPVALYCSSIKLKYRSSKAFLTPLRGLDRVDRIWRCSRMTNPRRALRVVACNGGGSPFLHNGEIGAVVGQLDNSHGYSPRSPLRGRGMRRVPSPACRPRGDAGADCCRARAPASASASDKFPMGHLRLPSLEL